MKRSESAFTLIELLLVIGIIAILLTLLIPVIDSALEKGREIQCKNNLRNIGQAMMAYAGDHEGRLPGSVYQGTGSEKWQRAWMGKEVVTKEGRKVIDGQWRAGRSYYGTLLPYLGVDPQNARDIYRCPSLPEGILASSEGSNGMFDYAMIKVFGGAKISAIPRQAVIYLGSPREKRLMTPLVVEEDPAHWVNGPWIEPGHSWTDRMGRWHRGGRGFYVALDGSIQELESKSSLAPQCKQWRVKVGRWTYHIGDYGIRWGHLPWN